MSDKQHGGRREGAGRKPKPESERLHPITVWLTPEQIEHCKSYGEASEHIRWLVENDRYRKSVSPSVSIPE